MYWKISRFMPEALNLTKIFFINQHTHLFIGKALDSSSINLLCLRSNGYLRDIIDVFKCAQFIQEVNYLIM